MTEDEFWDQLESRVTRELNNLDNPQLNRLWCDGFVASTYKLDTEPPFISGKTLICRGSTVESWIFILLLPEPFSSMETIRWDTILPPQEMSCWVTLELQNRILRIDPSSASITDT
jgi:hypothetical protein